MEVGQPKTPQKKVDLDEDESTDDDRLRREKDNTLQDESLEENSRGKPYILPSLQEQLDMDYALDARPFLGSFQMRRCEKNHLKGCGRGGITRVPIGSSHCLSEITKIDRASLYDRAI